MDDLHLDLDLLKDAASRFDMIVEFRREPDSEWEVGYLVGSAYSAPDGGPRLQRVAPLIDDDETPAVPITEGRLRVLGVMDPAD